jgi:hypothetical protein
MPNRIGGHLKRMAFFYSGGSFRERLISPRIFLFFIRLSTLDRVGKVDLRFLTGKTLAAISLKNRSVTSCLFRYCDLYFSDPSINIPSSVILEFNFRMTLLFCRSFRHAELKGDHRSSTRDSVLFTCCPPGPEDLLVLYFTSFTRHARME